jgi:hypothetical protein
MKISPTGIYRRRPYIRAFLRQRTLLSVYIHMATVPPNPGTGIYGTENITVRIHGLGDISRISKQLLADTDLLSRTRAIHITDFDSEDEEEEDVSNATYTILPTSDSNTISATENNSTASKQPVPETSERYRYFDENYVDEKMTAYCDPLVQMLDAISNTNHSLEAFSWTSEYGWEDMDGTRPKSFWAALWKHASSLQELDIGFYVHEVWRVPAPQVPFPALKVLKIDASTSHGDDGGVVEALLKGSPQLEVLDFAWPNCDLETCQITGVSWDYTFPELKKLKMHGYDFKPEALEQFLGRCKDVEELVDRTDRI